MTYPEDVLKAARDVYLRNYGWRLTEADKEAIRAGKWDMPGVVLDIADGIMAERQRCAEIALNPGFIQAQDTEWDLGVNYAKRFIHQAILGQQEMGNG